MSGTRTGLAGRWQAAPWGIRGAVALQALASLLVLLVVLAVAVLEDQPAAVTVGAVLLLGAVLAAVGVPLALWLLRRSAVAWCVWLLLTLSALGSPAAGGGVLVLLATGLSLVTLVLLLLPASLRWSWGGEASAYPHVHDVRRPD